MIKVLTAFFLLVCTVGAYAESPYVQVIDEGWRNHSGVVIKSGKTIKVLTCSHMVMLHGSKRINVKFYYGDTYISLPAKIKKIDHGKDLMLLEVSNVANIKITEVKVADSVENINCIINGYVFKNKQIIYCVFDNSVVTTSQDGSEIYNFKGKGVSGMSGSAILSNNKIVAIQSAGSNRIIGASFVVIKNFIGDKE